MRTLSLASLLVASEAQELVTAGARELVLVAEDSTAWGRDLGKRLPALVEALAETDGLHWLRLMYAYPHTVLPGLTTFLREHPKAVKYLDIPIQHISSPMLRAMKRGVKSAQVRGILDRLRDEVPGIAVRSTLITGFPGETEQDFEELKALVRDYRFERLGVFPYSREEDTPAHDMAGQVPQEVAEARAEELMGMQLEIMRDFHQSKVGETLEVLVDGYDESGEFAVGRSHADAPEVDCRVLLAKETAAPGDLVRAKITSAGDYEWVGEVVDEPAP